MSGDWIKMRCNLWDDPRVARICDLTDSSEGPVIGALYWLWATADQHTDDGCMPGLTIRQIDRKTGLPGFGAALVDVGWLTDDPQGVVLRNFDDHNGTSAKKRCQTARRVALHRACAEPVTSPALQEAYTHDAVPLAREEKRREEKDLSKPSASHPPSGGASGFDEFWEAWPRGERRQDKAKCLETWKRQHLCVVAEQILADVRLKRGTQKWRDGFVEAPLVYLRGKRWEDGVTPEVPPAEAAANEAVERSQAYLREQAAHKAVPPPAEVLAKLRSVVRVVS